jgi:hypothetical protein
LQEDTMNKVPTLRMVQLRRCGSLLLEQLFRFKSPLGEGGGVGGVIARRAADHVAGSLREWSDRDNMPPAPDAVAMNAITRTG